MQRYQRLFFCLFSRPLEIVLNSILKCWDIEKSLALRLYSTNRKIKSGMERTNERTVGCLVLFEKERRRRRRREKKLYKGSVGLYICGRVELLYRRCQRDDFLCKVGRALAARMEGSHIDPALIVSSDFLCISLSFSLDYILLLCVFLCVSFPSSFLSIPKLARQSTWSTVFLSFYVSVF